MKIALSEAENYVMHASKLANEIYNRRLYLQKTERKHSTPRLGRDVDITQNYLRHFPVITSD